MIKQILNSPRPIKRIISVFLDAVFVLLAFWGALLLRLENTSIFLMTDYWQVALVMIPVSVAIFMNFGLYRAILRYLSAKAIWSIVTALSASTACLMISDFFFSASIPKSVPVIYFALALMLIGGSRLLLRAIYSSLIGEVKQSVIIYGAGSAGRQLAIGLTSGADYKPVAFIDDDTAKQESIIQGIQVIGMDQLHKVLKKEHVRKILLALPSVTRAERKVILSQLERFGVQVQTIPGIKDVIEGRASSDEIRDVEIEDLLGRDPISPRSELMQANIYHKVVMVTGAGGSIGSELCRQIIQLHPTTLVLFELSEYGLYAIDRELQELADSLQVNVEIVPLIGSVQRVNRLENVMKAFNVDTVYHAAAYKHVPLVENNTVEGVRNNIFGTMYCAQAAIAANVETFVLVSTDKAVRPTNIMGATKRMAELVLQALSKEQSSTRFCMVRFGNVLGSSGSVVPLFRKQIQDGGPITLTHNDITRYFMTIPEAAQLVLQAGAMGKGGDVFVLDMGEPVKIYDLAAKLIRLSGLELKDKHNPHGDIAITTTGLRPGEKLYEELLIGDNVDETSHPRIMTAQELMLSWDELNTIIKQLDRACHEFDHQAIRDLLIDAPTAYKPNDPIVDRLYMAKQDTPALDYQDTAKNKAKIVQLDVLKTGSTSDKS
ncbi:nucleoside-diphosphate sugar epimerase/dehydratase [Glaciecola sp. HTCC2999]|uniref:polysaccharide biosynthesis protein n=1 Tax=Glaciecola sp. HTCC2999 TaxID=455436 RepID=UPI0000E0F5E4|nr:nucleoside-diphosphate sugar epimerase/dehydratase [Glaciecola sp. HTCC2999]